MVVVPFNFFAAFATTEISRGESCLTSPTKAIAGQETEETAPINGTKINLIALIKPTLNLKRKKKV